jgi:hypothetical protein
MTAPNRIAYLWLIQGLYYVLTGLWSVVSIRTFQWVTGPKSDLWLVKSVGILLGVIGGVLSVAGLRRQTEPEISLLAVGSALGMAGIDVVYVTRRRISPVYLVDALVEVIFVVSWVVSRTRRTTGDR